MTVGHPVDERFRFGQLRFLGGAANGETADDPGGAWGSELHLRSARPASRRWAPRSSFVERCDKRLATCCERFANAANFRGEPHLPGNDLLTRYPGA